MPRTTPRCPDCESPKMTVSGLVSFKWSRGMLRPDQRSAELVDGAPWVCEDCGERWSGNLETPFDFERAPRDLFEQP